MGITVSVEAVDRAGAAWWFDVTGAFTTPRSGLIRTDTLWKCLGRASVIAAMDEPKRGAPTPPLVLLTSTCPRPEVWGTERFARCGRRRRIWRRTRIAGGRSTTRWRCSRRAVGNASPPTPRAVWRRAHRYRGSGPRMTWPHPATPAERCRRSRPTSASWPPRWAPSATTWATDWPTRRPRSSTSRGRPGSSSATPTPPASTPICSPRPGATVGPSCSLRTVCAAASRCASSGGARSATSAATRCRPTFGSTTSSWCR